MLKRKNSSSVQREKLRNEFWPDEDAWTVGEERGWFRATRTLPLILNIMASKELSGKIDLTRVYIDLLASHYGEGIVEIRNQEEHAYSSGYESSRAVRAWQERIKILERIGFIKTKKISNQNYKYILIVHPTFVVQRLREAGKVSDHLYNTYRQLQIKIKEPMFEERQVSEPPSNVVPIIEKKAITNKMIRRKVR